MGAVEDLKAKVQAAQDEADAIKAGIDALVAASNSGNQAAIDAAVAAIVSDVSGSVDTLKQHLDAAQGALPAATTPPVQPPAPPQ